MGGLLSMQKETVETLVKETKTQVEIAHELLKPEFRFPSDRVEKILSIPLTDFHMRLTYEELTLIIEQYRPELSRLQAKNLALVISGGKSLKDPGASKNRWGGGKTLLRFSASSFFLHSLSGRFEKES